MSERTTHPRTRSDSERLSHQVTERRTSPTSPHPSRGTERHLSRPEVFRLVVASRSSLGCSRRVRLRVREARVLRKVCSAET